MPKCLKLGACLLQAVICYPDFHGDVQHYYGSHTYVCFYSNKAVKISYWTFKHIVFLIKVNVQSTMCEVHSMLFIWVHAKFNAYIDAAMQSDGSSSNHTVPVCNRMVQISITLVMIRY